MNRIAPRFLAVSSLATFLIAASAVAAAADKEVAHSFQVTIVGQLDMESQGQRQKVDGDTELRYTWRRSGQERTLSFDAMALKLQVDGKEQMNTSMSRAKVVTIRQGEKSEVLFENAPEQVKKILQDSFDAPVCKLQVDESGKEVKREVVAGPGAQSFIVDPGMIANAVLFHPPFLVGKDEWEADTEVTMGKSGYARGKLTYTKVASGNQGQTVRVSGTLTNDSFKQPGTQQGVSGARYLVRGEQTYDPAQKEWASGKLTIDVSFQMTADDKPIGSAKGQMTLSFAKLPSNE